MMKCTHTILLIYIIILVKSIYVKNSNSKISINDNLKHLLRGLLDVEAKLEILLYKFNIIYKHKKNY